MKKLTLFILAGLTSIYANAENWAWVASNDRGDAYVDFDSILTLRDITQALTSYEYFQTRPLSGTEGFNKTLLLEEFYCDSEPKLFRTLYTKAYLDDLEVALDESGFSADFEPVQPNTMASVKFDIVCHVSQD